MAYSGSQMEPTSEPEAGPAETEATDTAAVPEAENGDGNTLLCLFVTLYSICIVFILVGNILVAVTIMKNKSLRKNTSNLYLFSLVTARTCVGVFVVPGRITGLFSQQYLGSILCKLCHFFAMGSAASSVFSIMAIAVVNYLIIVRRMNMTDITNKQGLLLVAIIWFLGFLYAIRAPVVNDLVTIDIRGTPALGCTISEPYRQVDRIFIIVDMLFLFVLPFGIVIFCYSQVIATLSSAKHEKSENPAEQAKMDSQSRKAVKMLITLIILFTICTMSPLVLKIYVFWGGGFFSGYNIVEPSVYLFSYSNAWFNVVVFAVFRDDLRQAFCIMACGRRRKRWGDKVSPCGSEVSMAVSGKLDKETEAGMEKQKRQAMLMMDF